jgi:hypothetical protein
VPETLETINKQLLICFNLPSITIGTLDKIRVVPRTVQNVGLLETYTAVINEKNTDVDITVAPSSFTIAPGTTQLITFTLKAAKSAVYLNLWGDSRSRFILRTTNLLLWWRSW